MGDRRGDLDVLLNHGRGAYHGHRHEYGHGRQPTGKSRNPAGGQAGGNAQQERYVTSAAIESVRKKIETDAKQFFEDVKGYVDDTDVPGPGWGALGTLVIGLRYAEIQNDIRRLMNDGRDTMDAWCGALDTMKKNWRKAEDASTAVYQ